MLLRPAASEARVEDESVVAAVNHVEHDDKMAQGKRCPAFHYLRK